MHENTQDTIGYVHHYGHPNVFKTFTCKPAWVDIGKVLLLGQQQEVRYDNAALAFRQMLKSLMDEVFGSLLDDTVEWQKRGLPHEHVLICCMTQIDLKRN